MIKFLASPPSFTRRKLISSYSILAGVLLIAMLSSLLGVRAFGVSAQQSDGYWFDVQYLYAADFGLSRIQG